MDELGSSIRHSDVNANVCCTSFFFEPSQTMFTLLYPIVRIDQPYSEIFRNFVYDNKATLDRHIRLLPWQRVSERKATLRNLFIEKNAEMFADQLQNTLEVYEKSRQKDLYDKQPVSDVRQTVDADRVWKVYTDHDLVREYLNDQHYQLVDDPDQADILFVMKQWEDFRHETLKGKLVNQFPAENTVTNKELLALAARRWKGPFE